MIGLGGFLDVYNVLALLMVVVIGLPHGAFDAAVGHYLGAYSSRWAMARFVVAYSLIAALVVLCWMAFPGISLAVFLVVSMVHFGWGDATAKTVPIFLLQILSHGGVAVFGIVNFHLAEVTTVFDLLTNGSTAIALSVSKVAMFALPVLGLGYAGLALKYAELRRRFVELVVVALMLWVLPPLVGFAFYFCFIHTVRHMRHIWQKLQMIMPKRYLYIQGAGFTLASWILAMITFFWLDSGDLDQDILRVVFIGLAALTVPHMLLIDGFFRLRGQRRLL